MRERHRKGGGDRQGNGGGERKIGRGREGGVRERERERQVETGRQESRNTYHNSLFIT